MKFILTRNSRSDLQRCQELEARRLTFFREMLLGVHACLNLTEDSELPQIYDEFRHTVTNADHNKDLKYWENNHGDGMPTMWPQFEVSQLLFSIRHFSRYTCHLFLGLPYLLIEPSVGLPVRPSIDRLAGWLAALKL